MARQTYICKICLDVFEIEYGDVYYKIPGVKEAVPICDSCAREICESFAKTNGLEVKSLDSK